MIQVLLKDLKSRFAGELVEFIGSESLKFVGATFVTEICPGSALPILGSKISCIKIYEVANIRGYGEPESHSKDRPTHDIPGNKTGFLLCC
jgi:hypothetical protein